MGIIRTERLVTVTAVTEMLIGLSIYAFPGDHYSSVFDPVRTLLPFASVAFTASGILLLILSQHNHLPFRLRRLLLTPAGIPLFALAIYLAFARVWTGTVAFAGLAVAVTAVPWIGLETSTSAGVSGADLYALTIGIIEAVIGTLLLIWPEVLLPSIYGPVIHWMPVAGLTGLVGSAALILPRSGGGWMEPRSFVQRLVGAILPLILLYNFTSIRMWTGVLTWGSFALTLLGGWESKPADKGKLARAVAPEQEQAPRLIAAERMLQSWTWLMALVVMLISLLGGTGIVDPVAIQLFTVTVGVYNVITTWFLSSILPLSYRIFSHLALLTVATGLLLLDSGPINHTFLVFLVILPPLARELLGTKAGWILTALSLGTIIASESVHWLTHQNSLTIVLTELVISCLMVAMVVMLGMHKVAEEQRLLTALQASEKRFAHILSLAADAVVSVDHTQRIILFNRAAEELFGYTVAEVLGQSVLVLISADTRSAYLLSSDSLAGKQLRLKAEGTFQGLRKNGEEFPMEASLSRLQLNGHSVVTAIFRDVTERKRTEARMSYLANHDPLTGLYNRLRFKDDLERELAVARRYGTAAALLFLDLDGFKSVNDLFGHATGDALLKQVALTLRRSVRETDILARLGGDEFVCLLPRSSSQDAQMLSERILEHLQKGFVVAGEDQVNVTASIGIAIYPNHADSADRLMNAADQAMYQAKRSHNRFCVYECGH